MKKTFDNKQRSINCKTKVKNFFHKLFVLDDNNFFSNLFQKEFILRLVVYFVLGMFATIPVFSQNKMPPQEVLDKMPPGFIGPYIPIYIFSIIAIINAIYLIVLCYVNKLPKRFAWFNFLFVLFNLIFYIDFDFWGLRPFYVGSMLILLLSTIFANMLISPKYANERKLKYLIIGGFFFSFIGLVLRFGDIFEKTEGLLLFSKIIISFGIVVIYLFSIVSLFDYLVLSNDRNKSLLFTKILYTLYIIVLIFALPFLLKYYWRVCDTVLNTIVIPIYASSVAGILTLAGVGWTIKAQNKEIKNEKKQLVKPILLQKEFNSKEYETYQIKINDDDIKKYFTIQKAKKKYQIVPLCIKNTDNALARIDSIKINGNIINLQETIYIEKNEKCKIEFNFSKINNVPDKIIFIVYDLYNNPYEYEFKLSSISDNTKKHH